MIMAASFTMTVGGRKLPPNDEAMAAQVERVSHVNMLDFAAARGTGLMTWITPDVHEAYVALNVAQSLHPNARRAHLVFTPLHGTANTTVGAVFAAGESSVDLVAAQAVPDGGFPAVPYRAPNPEVPESMQQGMDLAREVGADAVFACDPDADRLGVVHGPRMGPSGFSPGMRLLS